jgi:hypothetical protein
MFEFRRLIAAAVLMVTLGLLSACAEAPAAPDAIVTPLAASEVSSLKIAEITVEAAPGAPMTSLDIQRLQEQIRAEISKDHPTIWLASNAPATPNTTKLKVLITRYDAGSAFGRFMLAGVGQIYIDGDVIFTDAANGRTVGEYKVSKDFSFGGIYGVVTRIEDVEKGFAKSVAQLLETKQSSIIAAMRRG